MTYIRKILEIDVMNTHDNFRAGKLKDFIDNWKVLTCDPCILKYIMGYKIEFDEQPIQTKIPNKIVFNKTESDAISSEINKFLTKQIIEEVFDTNDSEFISNIFLRPKKDGTFRMILNLRNLNECVEYHHFKMETLKTAVNLVTKNCWFSSIDFRDAYYSCNIQEDDRKYLRFYWNGHKFQYTCLAMGLASAPRIFTKMMKPVFSSLRKKGHTNVTYIDDSLLISNSEMECQDNVRETIKLVDSLGLTVHLEKSVLKPTQRIQFLGFWLDSTKMTVEITHEKADAIKTLCHHILGKSLITIREVAQLIGKLVASEPGVRLAPLYYKTLEIEKDVALKENRGNFDAEITLSQDCKQQIQWWIENVDSCARNIFLSNPDIVIKSDSSTYAWGATNTTNGESTRGHWTTAEKENHINYLELQAGFLAIQQLCKHNSQCHIQLFMDNTVAVSYVNKMGGKISTLNKLARSLWLWCLDRNIWITANHIAGVDNGEADFLSRDKHSDTEWMLNPNIFKKIMQIYEGCNIDLFASKFNKQLPRYVSFTPDKHAKAIDAFSFDWTNLTPYIFCPFSLLTRVLQKLEKDRGEAVLVAPIWPTQPWFAKLLHLIVEDSYVLPRIPDLLILPTNPTKRHPLKQMRLGMFRLSGKPWATAAYRNRLLTLSCPRGEIPQECNIGTITSSGCNFVIGNKLIRLKLM